MKVLALLLCLAVAGTFALDVESRFKSYMAVFKRGYQGAEYKHRLEVYRSNLDAIEKLSAENPLATFGENEYTDMTPEEFAKSRLMQPAEIRHEDGKRVAYSAGKALATPCLRTGVYQPAPKLKDLARPDALDWRTYKPDVVQSVKDQGQCGSCWAFSTVQNIEGVLGVAGKAVGSLSPQYVVDCSTGCSWEMINGKNTTVCNQGCNGGWPWTALNDVVTTTGVPGWTEYPYTGTSGTCKDTSKMSIHAKISGYTCIGLDKSDNEDEIADNLFQLGPLSIALDATPMQYYKNGIITNTKSCSTKQLNHAVLLVGYGSQASTKYWIVKNSWGSSWGEQGYCRMLYGSGICGINEAVSCAVL